MKNSQLSVLEAPLNYKLNSHNAINIILQTAKYMQMYR